jgi:pimeloyl-ACP methyl ester carboxylesterase
METGFATVNDTQLYYETAGAGAPLVLLHAGIADCRMWNAQFEVFAQQYRVIRYDRRGYGKSPLPAGDFSHRRDLYELLRFLQIDHAHLIGSSYGGSTALDFAREHPALVASLTIVGSTPFGFEFAQEPPPQAAALNEAEEAGDLARASELEVQIWVDGLTRKPEQVNPAVRQLVYEMNLIALENEIKELGDDQHFEDTATHLHEINAPTLIVWGDLDRPRTQAGGAYLAETIAGARHHIMTGTAHMPSMERPQEFNRVVLEFLRG